MQALIDSVCTYAENNPDGFTLNIETMNPVRFGISAAYQATQYSFGKEGLKHVIDHSLRHEKTVGGWLNDDDDQFYFDSVKIFRNSQLKEAIAFARQNEQIAIFDLTNLKEIRL